MLSGADSGDAGSRDILLGCSPRPSCACAARRSGVRDFRRLWIAQAISTVGDQIFPIAVAPLTVLLPIIGREEYGTDTVMATFGLMPLGLALTGPIAARVGQDAVLAAAIVSIVVLTLGVLRVPGVQEFRDPDVVRGLR